MALKAVTYVFNDFDRSNGSEMGSLSLSKCDISLIFYVSWMCYGALIAELRFCVL